MNTTIGILGGMGPMATVDFMQKIIQQTPAETDQDHLPLLVHSVPQIPDRTACLMRGQPSPLNALRSGLKTLLDAGVGCIAIPCNTAHFWHRDLAGLSPVPVLHIAEACCRCLQQQNTASAGLLATDGTLKAGFYPEVMESAGISLTLPDRHLQQQTMQGIYQVKAGQIREGGQHLLRCMNALLDTGVERVIFGCTEIPLALAHTDATQLEVGGRRHAGAGGSMPSMVPAAGSLNHFSRVQRGICPIRVGMGGCC